MQPAPEFEIGYHGELTELGNDGLLDNEQLGLVVAANIAQDLHQTKSYIHFDNCDFPGGVDYPKSEWNIIDQLGDKFAIVSLGAFGRLLHTTQDFYAHSNWIELHEDQSPIPVWNQELSTLPANIVSGTWWIGGPKLCGPNAPTHSQLNKDSPKSTEGSKIVKSGPNKGKSLFELAFATALAATKIQYARLAKISLATMPEEITASDQSSALLLLIKANQELRSLY